jgi:hypothetical protein
LPDQFFEFEIKDVVVAHWAIIRYEVGEAIGAGAAFCTLGPLFFGVAVFLRAATGLMAPRLFDV